MTHTIEIIDDLMAVLDEDGNGCDSFVLESYREAKRQISRWAHEYTFDVADAYRQLAEYFSEETES